MEVRQGRQARADSLLAIRQGDVPQGPAAEHPPVEQGSGGDSEASARRGVAVSDVDREFATQVRDWAAQRDLRSGRGISTIEVLVCGRVAIPSGARTVPCVSSSLDGLSKT